jgi:hypothetical protein
MSLSLALQFLLFIYLQISVMCSCLFLTIKVEPLYPVLLYLHSPRISYLRVQKNTRKMRYKGSPEEKAKAAQENGFDGDDDCIAFKEPLPYNTGCYEDLDYRTDYPQPSFSRTIMENI